VLMMAMWNSKRTLVMEVSKAYMLIDESCRPDVSATKQVILHQGCISDYKNFNLLFRKELTPSSLMYINVLGA
jgi:hypothetical protein